MQVIENLCPSLNPIPDNQWVAGKSDLPGLCRAGQSGPLVRIGETVMSKVEAKKKSGKAPDKKADPQVPVPESVSGAPRYTHPPPSRFFMIDTDDRDETGARVMSSRVVVPLIAGCFVRVIRDNIDDKDAKYMAERTADELAGTAALLSEMAGDVAEIAGEIQVEDD